MARTVARRGQGYEAVFTFLLQKTEQLVGEKRSVCEVAGDSWNAAPIARSVAQLPRAADEEEDKFVRHG